MTRQRLLAVSLGTALLVAVGCSSPRASEPTDTGASSTQAAPAPDAGPGAAASTGPAGSVAPDPTAGGAAAAAATTTPDAASAAPDDRAASDPAPSRYLPVPGDYVYDVTGHVETTGIGGGREPLPPVSVDTVTVDGPADRQEMTIATRNGDEGASQELAVVVTPEHARLTRLTYRPGGRGMAHDVRPDPPATIARFPYRAGDRWEIAWRDEATGIAGAGTGEVRGPEAVTTPVGSYDAMVVTVRQRLRGTVNGTLSVTSWLDPVTAAVVKQHSVADFSDATGASRAESERVLRRMPS